jgi:autotransporter passenger strand-loop-strand repeat protein
MVQRLTGNVDGVIDGDATVAEGTHLCLNGMITGNLTVEAGATCELRGTVIGSVINNGGDLQVFGLIQGSLVRQGGRTTVDSRANIKELILPMES